MVNLCATAQEHGFIQFTPENFQNGDRALLAAYTQAP